MVHGKWVFAAASSPAAYSALAAPSALICAYAVRVNLSSLSVAARVILALSPDATACCTWSYSTAASAAWRRCQKFQPFQPAAATNATSTIHVAALPHCVHHAFRLSID